MLVTFYEHPRTVLHSDYIPQLLTAPDEKLALLRETGVGRIEMLHFTEEMSRLTARDFMRNVLHNEFGVKVLVMGYDHQFGHGGGTIEEYVQWGQEVGIEVVRAEEMKNVETAMCKQQSLSSSTIRRLLNEGNVEGASTLLGHPYTLQGRVVKGHHIGHELGFPTANLQPHEHKLVPANGVYAVWVEVENGHHQGMVNIGERPTIDSSHTLSIEVNIFDFEGDLYGQQITIHFVERLREERHFESREALIRQIEQDEETARNILNINYH